MNIFKGIYYESNRNRWRVRLYQGNLICHLSYHDSEEEARAAYETAKQTQAVRPRNPPPDRADKISVQSALAALY